jgi:acetoacetate decarboxylase
MKKSDVLKLPSMPLQSPTFPRGPYRFFRRQYLVVSYQSDAAAIREALPEPLVPAGDTVAVQWLDLPDGEGFGAYSAAAQIIPCTFKGEPCNFVSQMYVDNTPPLAGGREIWGYPMKYGKAVLKVTGDTLTGTLDYATQRAATGTMVYKHDAFRADLSKEKEPRARSHAQDDSRHRRHAGHRATRGNQLRRREIAGVTGEARLELIPAVNCPLADLPVRRVAGGLHMVTGHDAAVRGGCCTILA